MPPSPLSTVHVAVVVLLGTLVRWLYGVLAEPWSVAPDQVAWGLLIAEAAGGPLRFDQLLYYPHEGATPLLSLAALPVHGLAPAVPALSWVALAVDTAGRALQIGAAARVFGRPTAIGFGWWTVAAVPGLLPWGTVNFGLHALSAFWPFALLWAIAGPGDQGRTRPAVLLGALLGLSLAWSYDSLALAPAAAGFVVFRGRSPDWRAGAILLGVATLAFLPHVLMRAVADAGFHLGAGAGLVRGEALAWPGLAASGERLARALPVLAGATLLPALGPVPALAVRLAWLAMVLTGVALAVAGGRRVARGGAAPAVAAPAVAGARRAALVGVAMVGTFLLLYAASPFFHSSARASEPVVYRHLAYILPLVAVLAIHGAVRARRQLLAAGFIALGVVGSTHALVRAAPPEPVAWTEAGWILSRKLGHDPARLARLAARVPDRHVAELAEGYGWGLAAALVGEGPEASRSGVERLSELVGRFPPELRAAVVRGIGRAGREDPALPTGTPVRMERGRRELPGGRGGG